MPPQRRIFGYAAIVTRGRGRADARKEKSTRSAGMKSSARAPRRRPSAKKIKKKEREKRTAKRARKGRKMRTAEILRRGAADRATLSRENHPLSFPRPPSRSFDATAFSPSSISIPRTLSPLATDSIPCLALSLLLWYFSRSSVPLSSRKPPLWCFSRVLSFSALPARVPEQKRRRKGVRGGKRGLARNTRK